MSLNRQEAAGYVRAECSRCHSSLLDMPGATSLHFTLTHPPTLPQVKDASLLRFLVDMRDADLEAKQMRDDLMTMLIAGGWA